jgi:hypothetical protein
MNVTLEVEMDFKKLVAATVIFVVTGGAYAQQTEFLAPDAGFKSAMTRAEVRMGQKEAYAGGLAAQRQHDGQDPLYFVGTQNRKDVRAETIRSARAHQTGDVRDNYFGEELKRW